MKTYEDGLDEMTDVVIKLVWNYTLFCALFEKQETYRETREGHPEFFLTMQESLFCSFCISVALLFNDKDKAESLCNLIQHIKTSKPDFAKTLNDKISAKKTVINKIQDIRHQAFAHRYKTKTQKQVWDEMRPRLNMMKDVADLARFIICELVEEAR